MKKGIINTLIFYGLGFGLSGLVYLVYGHPYIHAPGPHHFIIILTLLIGVIWSLVSIIKFLKTKASKLKGVILANLIAVISFVIYLVYLINYT